MNVALIFVSAVCLCVVPSAVGVSHVTVGDVYQTTKEEPRKLLACSGLIEIGTLGVIFCVRVVRRFCMIIF